jgi:hypothetical protein
MHTVYRASGRYCGGHSEGRHGDVVQDVRPLLESPEPLDGSGAGVERVVRPLLKENSRVEQGAAGGCSLDLD